MREANFTSKYRFWRTKSTRHTNAVSLPFAGDVADFNEYFASSGVKGKELLAEVHRATAASDIMHKWRPLRETLLRISEPEEEYLALERIQGSIRWIESYVHDFPKGSSSGDVYGDLGDPMHTCARILKPLLAITRDFEPCYVDDLVQESLLVLDEWLSSLKKKTTELSTITDARRVTMNLKDTVSRVVNIHKLASALGKIDYIEGASIDKMFRVDSRAIESILNHLLLNSRDAINGAFGNSRFTRGLIQVSVTIVRIGQDEYLEFSVQDNGVGMTEDQLQRLAMGGFSTKGVDHGSGMTTIQQIASWSAGYVKIDSAPGRGTRVRVGLDLSLIPVVAPTKRYFERKKDRGMVSNVA